MRVLQRHIGHHCIVDYGEEGRVDGMILEKESDDGRGFWTVWNFTDSVLDSVEIRQIIKIGNRVRITLR